MLCFTFIMVFLFIHFFAVRQTTLNTCYYWIERNLILGIISNTILAIVMYKYDLVGTISKNELIGAFLFSFCFPMACFYAYFTYLSRYNLLYKNGYFKLVYTNMFIV